MIRLLRLLLPALLALVSLPAGATVQMTEKILVGGETMRLFAQPLEKADSAVLARFGEWLRENHVPWNTACWRGYIGVWRLEKGMLWLDRVETIDGKPLFTGAELFPETAVGTRAPARWFSGTLRYGKGETVFFLHDSSDRNFEYEWVATVHKGRVKRTKAWHNRVYRKGLEPMENLARTAAALDTIYRGELPRRLVLAVTFAADSSGRVVRIDKAELLTAYKEKPIDDPEDPRLQAALRAFRAWTRWDACWVEGRWKARRWMLPLRRDGEAWKPPQR